MRSDIVKRVSAAGWVQEGVIALLALGIGFGLMPLLIFLAGSTLLGRYDGASAAGVYAAVYRGLDASLASWIVCLGPYCLYLLFRALRLWWRQSARLA